MTDRGQIILLERRLYSFADVDDLARLPPGTARRWLEGYDRGGKSYRPLLRERASGNELATWGEFVEADLVGRYRRKDVSVLQLRPVIERLRDELQTPYPLALERPLVLNHQLIRAAQTEFHVPRQLELVIEDLKTRQLRLAPIVEDFIESVDYEEDVAVRLRPIGKESPVQIDPLRAFGRPTVRSVRTERIAEAFMAGDSIEGLAEIYELPLEHIEAAIRFETLRADSRRAA